MTPGTSPAPSSPSTAASAWGTDIPALDVVFLNGTYGVGKSAVLDHVGDLLASAGTPFSLMDVDWFHRSSPPAPDDPQNALTEAANMRAVWTNYRAVGKRQLIVAGVLASRDDVARYADSLGAPIRSVRLTAGPAETDSRLHHRYPPERGEALRWHLDRYPELAERIASAGLDEAVIDTTARTPLDVAAEVVRHFSL